MEDFFFFFCLVVRRGRVLKPQSHRIGVSSHLSRINFRYKENKLRRKTLTENQLEWPHKKKKMTAKIFSESIYVSLYTKDDELSTTHTSADGVVLL